MFGFIRRKFHLTDDNKHKNGNDYNNIIEPTTTITDDDDTILFNYNKFHNGLSSTIFDAIKPATKTAVAISTPIQLDPVNKYPSLLPSTSKKIINSDKLNDSKIIFDKRLRTVLIGTVILIIIYKLILFSIPYAEKAKTDSFSELSFYVSKRMEDIFSSSSSISQNAYSKLTSFLCGIGFTLFSGLILYMDSYLPGIYPPSPFTPKSKTCYFQQKSTPIHIGYVTAILGGVVVSCLLYFDF